MFSSGGRIFGNRIQSNDYFEVIGVLDYRSQKVIVTKYPDPFAGPDSRRCRLAASIAVTSIFALLSQLVETVT